MLLLVVFSIAPKTLQVDQALEVCPSPSPVTQGGGHQLKVLSVRCIRSMLGNESEGMVDGQAKDDESGQVQAEQPNLVSGGVLRMPSPVTTIFRRGDCRQQEVARVESDVMWSEVT